MKKLLTTLIPILIIFISVSLAQTEKIAFHADGQIFVMNTDGTGITQLTYDAGNNVLPNMSYDGSKIVFISGNELSIVNTDGTGLRQVTNDDLHKYYPSFSPDGTKIVFEARAPDGTHDIYTVREDGTGLTRLTANEFPDSYPSFSPDGTQVVFVSRRGTPTSQVYLMNSDGTGQVPLTNDTEEALRPSFSPGGTHILYTLLIDLDFGVFDYREIKLNGSPGRTGFVGGKNAAYSSDGSRVIYELDGDLYAFRLGTFESSTRMTTGAGMEGWPSWGGGRTPLQTTVPGGRIVFTTQRLREGISLNDEIFSMYPDGTGQTNLTNQEGRDHFGAISRDGTMIVLQSERDTPGSSDIYLMNAEGSNPKRLTDDPAQDFWPTFSPDGSKVVFTSDRDGDFDIYLMNSDGTDVTQLTDAPSSDLEPEFSPDGSKIVFSSSRDGNWLEIYMMDANGENETRLTFNTTNDREPTFSPDGQKIAFNFQDFTSESSIYLMNPDGTDRVRISNPAIVAEHPSFSPDGSYIAFRGQSNRIMISKVDGTGLRAVTEPISFQAGDYYPTWGPVAALPPSDSTSPVIAPVIGGPQGTNGWYVGDVSLSWDVSDGESDVSEKTGCGEQVVTSDTSGITFTCTATSGGGTASQSVTVKRDAKAPTLAPSLTSDLIYIGSDATAEPNATDTMSGISSTSCGPLDTGTPGSRTVQCVAADNAGNTATVSLTYTVMYRFAGFFQPVDNLPALNIATAGSSIPVKFSLTGYQGLNIFVTGSPASGIIPCDSSTSASTIEETVNAGGSSLSYDAVSDRYIYVWKTEKSWKGTCRQLRVRLNDGGLYVANFRFK